MKTTFHIIGVICTAAACALLLPSSANTKEHLVSAPIPSHGENAGLQEALDSLSQELQVKGAQSGEEKGHIISITMYMQGDPAWSSFLYGGQDPMAVYGCGPTALAMAAATLAKEPITPVDVASWAADNGYYAPQSGSVHALIPNGARNYGLTVEILNNLTPDNFRRVLSVDKLLILLMGPGDFSDSGHFIVAYGYDGNGDILVADPASAERSSAHWPAEILISQVLRTAKNGGPVWVLSKP